jgi:hypothetical protein
MCYICLLLDNDMLPCFVSPEKPAAIHYETGAIAGFLVRTVFSYLH